MTTASRRLTRLAQTGTVALLTIAMLGMLATNGQAQSFTEYVIKVPNHVPKSAAVKHGWLNTRLGATFLGSGLNAVGSGTAIGAGTFSAAVVGAAAVGGYVGWAIYEGSLTPWDVDDPLPPAEGWGVSAGGTDLAGVEFVAASTYIENDSDGSRIIRVGWNADYSTEYRHQCKYPEGTIDGARTASGWTSDTTPRLSYDCSFYDGQPNIPWRVQVRQNNTTTGYEEVYFSSHAEADRRIEVTGTCTDPVTGTSRTVSASSGNYVPGNEPAVPGVQCNPGEILTDLTVQRITDGGDVLDLLDYSTPDAMTDPNDEYADCWQGAASGDPCEIMLYRIDGTTRYDCNTHEGLCTEWSTDPDRETVYECRYGQYQPGDPDPTTSMPHVLPLSDCFYLERAFDGDTAGELVEESPTNEATPPATDSNPFKNALRWAFAPSKTAQAIEDMGIRMETKAPIAQFESMRTWLRQIEVGLNPTQECWRIAPEVLDYGEYVVLDSCDTGHQVSGILVGYRGTLRLALFGALILPVAWWAWRQFMPGTSVENG